MKSRPLLLQPVGKAVKDQPPPHRHQGAQEDRPPHQRCGLSTGSNYLVLGKVEQSTHTVVSVTRIAGMHACTRRPGATCTW